MSGPLSHDEVCALGTVEEVAADIKEVFHSAHGSPRQDSAERPRLGVLDTEEMYAERETFVCSNANQ